MSGKERRVHDRFPLKLKVDYQLGSSDDFLFSYIENISETGIFVATNDIPEVGTEISIRFTAKGEDGSSKDLELDGTVVWTNKPSADGTPGMGIKFHSLDDDTKDAIMGIVRTVAYLPSSEGEA